MIFWSLPRERVSRSLVELDGNRGEQLTAVETEIRTLRKVLAEETVRRSYVCQAVVG